MCRTSHKSRHSVGRRSLHTHRHAAVQHGHQLALMSLLLTWAQMTGAHHTERQKNKMIWEADILWCNYQMTILVFRPHVAHFLMSRVKWVKAIWLKQQKMSLQHVCFVGKWMIDCSSAHTHCNAESHKEVYSLSEARLLKIHPQPNTYYWCSVQICVTAFLAKVYTDRKKSFH